MFSQVPPPFCWDQAFEAKTVKALSLQLRKYGPKNSAFCFTFEPSYQLRAFNARTGICGKRVYYR